ncbi:MAG: DEAD/DEAH box helicase [Caldilineaceae bacterium]|nr:DEAD/DEAH box helicase [Caldilineaceae bacterium]
MGDDLRFWQAAARLALEALVQQKYMPGLIEANGDDAQDANLYARWLPVLDGPRDGPRLTTLRNAMPPLCRADAEEDEPGARFLLDTFLNAMVDDLVRRWAVAGERQSRDAQTALFLDALTSRAPERTSERAPDRARNIVDFPAAQKQQWLLGYRAWLRNLRAAGDAYFRVALRLEPPASGGDDEKWALHYLLQARDDPSLLIDAAQIWARNRLSSSPLADRLGNAQELLLTGLGFAARLSSPIRESLQSKQPAGARLSSDEAYAYLREAAPLLEESSFGVFVPPWWNKPNARLGVRLQMSGQGSSESAASGLLTMENLVSYQWQLSVAGEPLNEDEFQSLVALKSPLVQVRGQWVQLDPEQIEAAIRFWQRQDGRHEIGLLDAAGLALNAQETDGLTVEGVDAQGWFKEWLDRFTGRETLEVLDTPAALHAELRPYQRFGYSWLDFQRRWQIGACLADDMGLGKTIQTLAMLQQAKDATGSLPAPMLLIAPTSVVVNWAKEAARFTPGLSIMVHQGGDRLRGDEFVAEAGNHDIVATSYALVRRDEDFLKPVRWFGVVLDEAQNIKNAETKQARVIRRLDADFRLALTGTPVENRLSELWSIMQFLNPGFLGSQRAFRQNFALPIERNNDESAAQRLRRMVTPFILRRVKTDPTVIQDLPEKQETKEYCTLSTEQATLYEAVVQNALQSINSAEDDMTRRGLVLSMLMKLKQICNHPGQFLHQLDGEPADNPGQVRSGKLARLSELLDELLDAGDRALIFSQFTEMGGYLQKYLQLRYGRPVLFLHGGVPARRRQEMVERFQDERDGPPIFVLSLKAGGTGLNLTQANHVFHYDRWWNPAVEDQATDRAFRIGQTRNVQVHKFVCVGTLEEKIDAMIEEKKALAQAIVGGGENWLTELSTDDLRDLVLLRKELVQ